MEMIDDSSLIYNQMYRNYKKLVVIKDNNPLIILMIDELESTNSIYFFKELQLAA